MRRVAPGEGTAPGTFGRRAGHPLHDRSHASDLWIAASAIHIDAPLLTADSVFENTPGLTLHQ